jgi:tellurite methyltransferase
MSRFDEIYETEPHYFGREPSRLVARFHPLIPARARVLDIGIGQGRNAIFLARRGRAVVGVDTSLAGLAAVGEVAEAEGLDIDPRHANIMEFDPRGATFGAVLALGIVPLLRRSSVDLLFRRIDEWTSPGGLVFVTAFLTRDVRYGESRTSWEAIGRNSFKKDGRIRTFLEPGEVLTLLPGYRSLYLDESLGPEHRHPDRPVERHYLAQCLARKPRLGAVPSGTYPHNEV